MRLSSGQREVIISEKTPDARTQNQPTGDYDQAPAMNWDLVASWGRGSGLAIAIALGSGWPTGIET